MTSVLKEYQAVFDSVTKSNTRMLCYFNRQSAVFDGVVFWLNAPLGLDEWQLMSPTEFQYLYDSEVKATTWVLMALKEMEFVGLDARSQRTLTG